jgi:hypothetical protein
LKISDQRTQAVVLHQRTRTEVATAKCAEPTGVSAERHAAARDPGRRAGDAVAGRIEIGEAGAGIGNIQIERHPRPDLVPISERF